MTLTVQFLQQERVTVQQEIVELEKQLEQCSNQDKLSDFKKANNYKLDHFRRNIQLRKRTKLERDREDYNNDRVYNWSDPNYYRTKTYRKGQQKQFINSSSSTASTGSSTNVSTTFLPATTAESRLGGVVEDERKGTTRGMTTRRQNRQRW